LSRSYRTLLNYGKYHRIWPYVDTNGEELYVSVALVRPYSKPICKLLVSRDHGESWSEIADFHSLDRRNTTSGQPFLTSQGTILAPMWNAGFYTHGRMWFAIYRSKGRGTTWEKVYEDPMGTYGKHFFEDSTDGSLYIGVGVGGGGSNGKVSSTPSKSYLLKSTDAGETWTKVLHINYPTAIYDGTAKDQTILVTAREKKSVFKSMNGGRSWIETTLGRTARNIANVKELNKFVVTSNSRLFVSQDGVKWININSPIRLMFRYPIFRNGKLYMTGVGWRSLVISTDINKWYVIFDATKIAHGSVFARMSLLNDYIFIGDEMNGILLRLKLQDHNDKSVTALRLLEYNARCLSFIVGLALKRFKKSL